MSNPDTPKSEQIAQTGSTLSEELDRYRKRIRKLERTLADQDRDLVRYRDEASRLARTFQPAKIRAWYWDAETRLTQYLPLGGDLRDSWGRSASDISLAEDRLRKAVHPDDRERLTGVWNQANSEHQPYEVKYRILHSDGTQRHQHEIGTPEFDETGRYLGHVGTTQDITEQKLAEQALRESEARYKVIVEDQSELISRSAPDGRRTFVNEAFCRYIGKPADEIVGTSIYDSVPADKRNDSKAHFESLTPQNSRREFESQLLGRDGAYRWFHWIDRAIFDDLGRAAEYQSVGRDITDHREMEAAFRESESRYRTIFDTATAGIGRTFLDDGKVILSNKKLAQMFGYDSVDEYVSKFVFSDHYANPEDRARLMSSYKDSPGAPIECTFTKRDGSPVIVQAHAIANYEEGILDFVATDITDQKLAEQALLESEERLRSLLDNSPNLICLKDVGGRYLFLNRRFEEVQGVSRSNTLGKTAYEIFPESLASRFAAHDSDVMESQDVIIREEHDVPGADGIRRDYISCRFPLYGLSGDITGIANIDTDITEHRMAEDRLRQAQKMEAVGQLTGGVAHDFNNLLAVIMGNMELLEGQLGREDQSLKAIYRATTRGAELTQRLLAYSRQQPLNPQVIDLGDLISGMSDLLTRALGETIEIETGAAPDLWSALADPGQVENALLNLALNARDAMPEGGKLTITCANIFLNDAYVAENLEVKVGDYVVLAVSDEGSGMTAAVQDHAFEPFFTTKEVGQGSGLGLSMVYGFAKQSSGHVIIHSREGEGTTVKLYLPRAGKAAKPEAARPNEKVLRGQGEVILVIEDDPGVRDLAVRILEELGYRAIDVCDAVSAHKVLAAGEPVDLVLSDVVLPGGTSGPEFAEDARATNPDLKVIFMSGYPAQAAKSDGFLGSDKTLLNKPFKRQQLAKALRDELDGSQVK